MSQSKFVAYQQASLSQKVSHLNPLLKLLSGTDQDLSDSIAVISYISDPENRKLSSTDFVLGLLNVLRLSHLATSPTTNEITKLGFMLPKEEALVTDYNEEG